MKKYDPNMPQVHAKIAELRESIVNGADPLAVFDDLAQRTVGRIEYMSDLLNNEPIDENTFATIMVLYTRMYDRFSEALDILVDLERDPSMANDLEGWSPYRESVLEAFDIGINTEEAEEYEYRVNQ